MVSEVKKDEKGNPIQTRPKLTKGQVIADKLTKFAGSWTFIIIFLSVLFVWMLINGLMIIFRWDPYPFILLNLVLSCIAALQAPIILMSQNRTTERDRVKAERDYYINRKSEREIEDIQQDLDEIKKLLHKLNNK
jgi:uncharacterized membrane protein